MKNILYLILSATLFAACSSDSDSIITLTPENVGSNNDGGKYATNYEVPRLNDEDIFLTYTTSEDGKEQVTYSVAYNIALKHARWVAFTFDNTTDNINWNRNNWKSTEWRGDPWDYAPEIPAEYQMDSSRSIYSIYGLSGYDRGHLVASYDRLYSKEANRHTFYSINMSPMRSTFNQDGPWNKLETRINNRTSGWCTTSDVLYVVKGATIREGEYDVKNTLTIPKKYFMALVRQKNNSYYGIAFLLGHNNNTGGNLSDYAMSIDELEEATGIDFFCNLPDKLENTLESSKDLKAWNL